MTRAAAVGLSVLAAAPAARFVAVSYLFVALAASTSISHGLPAALRN